MPVSKFADKTPDEALPIRKSAGQRDSVSAHCQDEIGLPFLSELSCKSMHVSSFEYVLLVLEAPLFLVLRTPIIISACP